MSLCEFYSLNLQYISGLCDWLSVVCFKLEAIVVEMHDPKNGVKGSVQKLNVTTIPHAVAGENNTLRRLSNTFTFVQSSIVIIAHQRQMGLMFLSRSVFVWLSISKMSHVDEIIRKTSVILTIFQPSNHNTKLICSN